MLYAWSKLKRQSVYKRKLINTSGEITGFLLHSRVYCIMQTWELLISYQQATSQEMYCG